MFLYDFLYTGTDLLQVTDGPQQPIGKVYVRYLFHLQPWECPMLSIMHSVIINVCCLPELNATRVIKITEK